MRRAQQIRLTATEQFALEMWIACPQTSSRHRLRFKIALAAASGRSNQAIADELSTTAETVSRWRGRFAARGLAGIQSDARRSGRPPTIDEKTLIQLMRRMRFSAKLWSMRSMAKAVGISKSSVQRAWAHVEVLLQLAYPLPRSSSSAPSIFLSAPTLSFTPDQLERARRVHGALHFFGLSFEDFEQFVLERNEILLQHYERAAVAFQKYETKHGLTAGKEAHSIGCMFISISFAQLTKPTDVPPAR